MIESKKLRGAALVSLFSMVLLGCSSTQDKAQDPAPVEDRTEKARATPPANPTSSVSGAGTTNISSTPIAPGVTATTSVSGRSDPALRDPNSMLSRRNIFFEYDAFVVAPEYRVLVEAHAKYLVANRGARMRIEGNTDERGSREYNLALGQRRADAVRRALVVLGANESQIETVSFGEEKPRGSGQDEGAMRENRRADLVYAGE
jgi:peptidoglycan-associated lipoprotein